MKPLNQIVADLEYCKEWKPIPGFEGLYEVSNMGDVQSARRSGAKGGLRKIYDLRGYYRVSLSKNNKSKPFILSRLVAMAFIPNPENKPQVNHKDGNKANNCVENLEWCTSAENYAHKMDVLGKDDKGIKNGHYGYKKSKLYPSPDLRNELCKLGIPRYRHNIAELGEMLPLHFASYKTEEGFEQIQKVENFEKKQLFVKSKYEADARAKMLIYLLKNNIISLEEVNKNI